MPRVKQKIFLFFLTLFLFAPLFIFADIQNEVKTFSIDPSYAIDKKEQTRATLRKVSEEAYFYLEDSWYSKLDDREKKTIDQNLDGLSKEFDNKIYPELTALYGPEWRPGIDGYRRITILFHQMREGVGGYFNSGDEYPKIENPKSNRREMIYVNADYLKSDIIKSLVAHEFTHLITFNQKDRLRGATEDTWLNEMRAELSPTILGYDSEYQGSNLRRRVRQFISSPSDSLTEWQGKKDDYGIVNLFGQYLLGHYKERVLADSMRSKKAGISSINEALEEEGVKKTFSDIFTDWTVAVLVNNCQLGKDYCYTNKDLKNLRIVPTLIFLPSTRRTSISLNYFIKQWSGNWYRVMGGEGDLKLDFNGENDVRFRVPYVLCKGLSHCAVRSLKLDKDQDGEILIKDFSKNWNSLTLVPSIQSKISNFSDYEPFHSFSVSISLENQEKEEKLIKELQAMIAKLQSQIAQVKSQIAAILASRGEGESCSFIGDNLYYGMRNNPAVRCLQRFLESQGPDIYPEGLITGNFGPLTRAAVIRFQQKYSSEILAPLGLKEATGFVGWSTRNKINKLLRG